MYCERWNVREHPHSRAHGGLAFVCRDELSRPCLNNRPFWWVPLKPEHMRASREMKNELWWEADKRLGWYLSEVYLYAIS